MVPRYRPRKGNFLLAEGLGPDVTLLVRNVVAAPHQRQIHPTLSPREPFGHTDRLGRRDVSLQGFTVQHAAEMERLVLYHRLPGEEVLYHHPVVLENNRLFIRAGEFFLRDRQVETPPHVILELGEYN